MSNDQRRQRSVAGIKQAFTRIGTQTHHSRFELKAQARTEDNYDGTRVEGREAIQRWVCGVHYPLAEEDEAL